MKYKRTMGCGEPTEKDAGREIVLSGWVQRRRDHGGVLFIDLRDRTGLVQTVFIPKSLGDNFAVAEGIRSEYVITLCGKVRERPEDAINPNLTTGKVEVLVSDFQIISECASLPFPVEDNIDTREEVRLRYRYVDLRRPEMQKKIKLRHDVNKAIRDYLDQQEFLEIETPFLTRSTPEGARDYLVPSREMAGHFYALPQSPQLFKQVLMVAGVEKYFQMVRCFRDEDLRGDRQPEFTQLDIEMSFIDEDDIFQLVEGLLDHILQQIDLAPVSPIPKITYEEAMERYGSDKPDVRFGLELQDVSHVFLHTDFKIFKNILAEGGAIKAINMPGGGKMSRKDIEDLEEIAKQYGAQGLIWIALKEENIQSPIKKFLREEEIISLQKLLDAGPHDLVLMVAGEKDIASQSLGQVRLRLGRENQLEKPGFHFLWVTHFPLLKYSQEEKRYETQHHPFTMPHSDDAELLVEEPEKVRARAYDLVVNGVELASGSIRIHQEELQKTIFDLLGFSPQEVQERFSFLMDAFHYGTPPHGGIAFGFDRLLMVLSGDRTIREVIPFPKTLRGTCPLTGAPGKVDDHQLQELHLRILEDE